MSKRRIIKKVFIGILVIILGMAAVFYVGLQMKLKEFSREISNIEINDVNLNRIRDGVYVGEYQVNEAVGAILRVTVKNNKITNIEFVEHRCGRGKKAEAITDRVIDKQSLNVDAISGATGSSIVILKAIENAISQQVVQ